MTAMELLPLSGFLASILAAIYFILGYPLLLAYLARRRPEPLNKQFSPCKVTVILAVRNGEKWLAQKLGTIFDQTYPQHLLQIIVVSDGSTDQTDVIAQQFRERGVELVQLPASGKAEALNAGMRRASGDVLFFTDVRQPLDPECLRKLVACLGDPAVGAASGQTLFLGGEERAHLGMYWRYERWLRQNLSRLDSLLAGTCIFVVRRELADPLPAGTLLDDSWLPLSAFLRGYRWVLEPEAIAWDYPNELRSEFTRKVRTLAGIYQIAMLRPQLLAARNRMRFHFISYRLGRVLLPFVLLITLATSFALPGMFRVAVLSAWLALFLAAAADILCPETFALKRLTSAARTFLVLMAASLCAVAIFFVPANSLWRDAWTDRKQVSAP